MKSRGSTTIWVLATSAAAALACSQNDGSTPARQPDAGPADVASGDAAPSCPVPTHGPTMHSETITADTTWTADGSPHVVTQYTQVLGVTLTVEPCATVEIAAGAGLDFLTDSNGKGSALKAVGTAQQPIRFSARDATPWNSLTIRNPSTADLEYVTLTGGGGDTKFSRGTTLVVDGGSKPVAKLVTAKHSTITKSVGLGLWLQADSGLSDDSTDLTISQCGDASDPYPLRVSFSSAGAIPPGTYTGNARDQIIVDAESITNDVTMDDRGVPYRMGDGQSGTFQVAASALGGTPAVLTIAPNVKLAMGPATVFVIGVGSNTNLAMTYPGSIVAQGTAAQPIVFTSAADTPAPGDWVGLQFTSTTAPADVLDHVSVEYAGGHCGCDGFSCLPAGDTDESSILVWNWVPPSEFLTNSAIVKGAGNGVLRGWAGPGPSFLAGNTFDVAHCPETLYVPLMGGCPANVGCE